MKASELASKFLILFGCILAINPFLWLAGMPIYGAGTILLWTLVSAGWPHKVKWTFYPLLIPLTSAVALIIMEILD